ncbi:hypothetical protein VOLCADRAFT_97264 [Volvox carteri f. nagariensis]|uniref:Uncharacterized protein n=1 Tax=Volvox carteri f. nagariensis TaxID=3068 RepID=D8UCA5_VOLCA|nr:uncharacterized protein VOLCADRAFT_97264 [Volvox carteri f. nagariensis]EFJ42663.1 hypothetical protein VOLCADRAFT_97264 [Volvox carteri f. nagariensis]|eukprot:XP_002956314.1 hypothetical protein VOLCADRAFT_97264 [Volvox carteri f. nagariensis]
MNSGKRGGPGGNQRPQQPQRRSMSYLTRRRERVGIQTQRVAPGSVVRVKRQQVGAHRTPEFVGAAAQRRNQPFVQHGRRVRFRGTGGTPGVSHVRRVEDRILSQDLKTRKVIDVDDEVIVWLGEMGGTGQGRTGSGGGGHADTKVKKAVSQEQKLTKL